MLVTATLLVVGAGCGGKFELPTEKRVETIPSDKSYQMLKTWFGMNGINDVLLTQGTGAQLFLLFNDGSTGVGSRGSVHAYPLTRPEAIVGIDFPTLFNPFALTPAPTTCSCWIKATPVWRARTRAAGSAA
jgi:hypothetical protein